VKSAGLRPRARFSRLVSKLVTDAATEQWKREMSIEKERGMRKRERECVLRIVRVSRVVC
jgi:hypothetical protein